MREQILFPLVLIAQGVASPIMGASSSKSQPLSLRFSPSGTFQLSVFEDLHYGEGKSTKSSQAEDLDWGPAADVKSTKVMNEILTTESPQLVVLNGDLITGENTYLTNSTNYLDVIVQPLVQRSLFWASTYGNHDANFNLSTQALLAREKQYALSLTQSMVSSPNAGVSNYWLPVFSSDSSNPTPKLLIWFFDSRGGKNFQELDAGGNQIQQPGFVDDSVVQWFTQTNTALTKSYNRTIPSIAFVHIPVEAMFAFQQQGIDAHEEPGINDDDPLAQQGVTCTEDDTGANVCNYTGDDVSFMSALINTPELMGVFSGHDHGDDWCFKWNSRLPGMNLTGNGINLCFGRHSGYGGYGTWTRGSRQILLSEETLGNSLETWIRLEDGSISGKVTLNSTYGIDQYPAVNDTFT